MKNLGIGVMLGILSGNEQTVNAINTHIGKKIKNVALDIRSDELQFVFEDGTELTIWDGGQSCCEHRYMKTDDDLEEYSGAILLDFELKSAPNEYNGYDEYYMDDVHEIQFLDVKTDKGIFQMANHNEHNGYYGGFLIEARTN